MVVLIFKLIMVVVIGSFVMIVFATAAPRRSKMRLMMVLMLLAYLVVVIIPGINSLPTECKATSYLDRHHPGCTYESLQERTGIWDAVRIFDIKLKCTSSTQAEASTRNIQISCKSESSYKVECSEVHFNTTEKPKTK